MAIKFDGMVFDTVKEILEYRRGVGDIRNVEIVPKRVRKRRNVKKREDGRAKYLRFVSKRANELKEEHPRMGVNRLRSMASSEWKDRK